MIVCPNAKINLGLEVLRRRDDGFHDIETVFVPVPGLRDVLEIVKAPEAALFQYGTPCGVEVEKNLCFRAFRLMQKLYGIGNINIFLYKNIPMGAGLGGGSSDAAFTLLAINDVFELGLSLDTLAGIAAQLGSDCPFFIYNQPMFASGRGEILDPYPLDLTGYHIEVVTPGIHISTPEAYKGVDEIKFASEPQQSRQNASGNISPHFARLSSKAEQRRGNGGREASAESIAGSIAAASGQAQTGLSSEIASLRASRLAAPVPYANYFFAGAGLKERIGAGIEQWRENVVNDFEAYAFAKYPILAQIKQSLYDRGAVYAAMTGSGSALYGILPNL